MTDFVKPFSDPEHVARYAEGPPRFVPGLSALHRMTGVLLEERAGPQGRALVLGAGGGLELTALADDLPAWTFEGVDPAQAMLDLAERALGPRMDRVRLHQGYIDDAPDGPFDAATCLLTLHFLPVEERRRTAEQIRRRLKPGAPLVVAHCSFPQDASERDLWLARYAAFARACGVDPAQTENARTAVAAHLHTLSPAEDEAVLLAAGFSGVSLFYAAFTWRGWVGYA